MATTKKYISLDKLAKYDELLKAKIATDDAASLQSAKDYADSLASNYEVAGAAETAKTAAIAAAKTETTTQVNALANGAVKDNADAIAAIKDDATVDSFADVVAELAKKQNTGDYATKAEAQGYANAKDGAIAAAKAAGDAAQATANTNANAIAAINHKTTGILAQAKGYTDAEVADVQAAVDTLAGKVGTVPAGSTVMGIIADIQENAYDDTELTEKIDGVSAKVTTLIGDDANKSVRTIANEELAAQLIAEGAAESLDTLQEIAQWIQDHPDDAAAMNLAITALQNKVDTGDKTVSAYVNDAITALNIGDYAKAADLTALAGRVGALETAAATYATKTEVNTAVDTLGAADTALGNRIAALEGAIGESGSVADDIAAAKQEAIETAAADAANKSAVVLAEAQAYADGLNTSMGERVATLESAASTYAKASDLTALTGRVNTAENEIDTLQTEMDAVEALAAANKAAHEANTSAIALKASQTALDAAVARIAANETAIGAFVEVSEAEINALFA